MQAYKYIGYSCRKRTDVWTCYFSWRNINLKESYPRPKLQTDAKLYCRATFRGDDTWQHSMNNDLISYYEYVTKRGRNPIWYQLTTKGIENAEILDQHDNIFFLVTNFVFFRLRKKSLFSLIDHEFDSSSWMIFVFSMAYLQLVDLSKYLKPFVSNSLGF